MSEAIRQLEDIKKSFLRQAKTFRSLAKVVSKHDISKNQKLFCETLAQVCDLLAELADKKIGEVNEQRKDHQET